MLYYTKQGAIVIGEIVATTRNTITLKERSGERNTYLKDQLFDPMANQMIRDAIADADTEAYLRKIRSS